MMIKTVAQMVLIIFCTNLLRQAPSHQQLIAIILHIQVDNYDNAKQADPHQTVLNEQSDKGLQCLQTVSVYSP